MSESAGIVSGNKGGEFAQPRRGLGYLVPIGVFEDGLVLHCSVEKCERIGYTIKGGDALCWGHYQEKLKG